MDSGWWRFHGRECRVDKYMRVLVTTFEECVMWEDLTNTGTKLSTDF